MMETLRELRKPLRVWQVSPLSQDCVRCCQQEVTCQSPRNAWKNDTESRVTLPATPPVGVFPHTQISAAAVNKGLKCKAFIGIKKTHLPRSETLGSKQRSRPETEGSSRRPALCGTREGTGVGDSSPAETARHKHCRKPACLHVRKMCPFHSSCQIPDSLRLPMTACLWNLTKP